MGLKARLSSEQSSESKIKIYKPKFGQEEKPLPLDSKELEYAKKLLEDTSPDGFGRLRVEEDIILERVGKDIYKSPLSGLRELFNNAVRFCQIAKAGGANPAIHVTINPEERLMTIHEVDSMGMSMDKYKQIYKWIGRSDNFDGKQIGQFGMGRLAFLQLSDILLLETYSREKNEENKHERFAILLKGASRYQVLPEPTDLVEFGTRLSMVVRDNIKFPDLIEYLMKIARFTGIDCFLTLTANIPGEYGQSHDAERPHLRGAYQLGSTTILDWMEKKLARHMSSYENRVIERKIPIMISNEIFDFYSWIVIYKETSSDWRRENRDKEKEDKTPVTYDAPEVLRNFVEEMLLLGTPIANGGYGELRLSLPMTMWVLNIKDERSEIKPTADRERLIDESMNKLISMLREEVKAKLALLNIKSIEEWKKSELQTFYVSGREEYEKLLSHDTQKLMRLLRAKFHVTRGKQDMGWKSFYELIEKGIDLNEMIFIDSWREDYTRERIRAVFTEKVILVTGHMEEKNKGAVLKELGIQLSSDLFKEHPELFHRSKKIGEVVVYKSYRPTSDEFRKGVKREKIERFVDKSTLDNIHNCFKIKEGQIRLYLSTFKGIYTKYQIIRDDGMLPMIKDVHSFASEIAGKKVATNHGQMLVRDIIQTASPTMLLMDKGEGQQEWQPTCKNKVRLFFCTDVKIIEYLSSEPETIIPVDDDTAFELITCFKSFGIEYEVDREGEILMNEEIEALSSHSFCNKLRWDEHWRESEVRALVYMLAKELPDLKLQKLILDSMRNTSKSEIDQRMIYVMTDLGQKIRKLNLMGGEIVVAKKNEY